ncbi:MAG: hemerythrin domain-containing protein [Cocleimonas sp.]|nr:hemerythrin domain-containing protein [Cocleimonas sp.]
MLNTVSKLPVKKKSDKTDSKEKNIFLKDIDMKSIKEILLKEIDVPKLKESLVEDIKASLLKEIDVSSIKEMLTKENSDSISVDETILVETPKINLPAYRYGLTESFIEDHQELLSIYENIMASAKKKEYTMLPMMLSKFSKKCLSHFNEEEELYIFMKALASSRSDIEKKVAREFTMEMKNLSVSLFTILNQSNYIPVSDNSVDGFVKEFETLGDLIKERISREEKILFPMYENSRKVVDIC